MPFLQFLNGSRDQQFEALNEQASLVVGSGGEAHIRVSDPGVEGKHCTVYPAQGAFWLQDLGAGSTIFKMKRLAGTTEGLQPGDIFIVGGTFLKYWKDKPAGGDGGDGAASAGGADPAALAAAKEELAKAKAELESARAGAGKAGELEGQLAEVKGKLTQVEHDLSAAQAKAQQAEADAASAKAEAESQVAEAQEAARAEREEVESALAAARAELEALRAEADARGRDSFAAARGPSDLAAALDALGLPDALRARLEAAVASEVDREVLTRMQGPVVPLRGLRIPGVDRDLEAELKAVQQRGEQVQVARELGLQSLDAGELERLLELART